MSGYTQLRFSGSPDEVNRQWLEARRHGIGGSDVAAIMGVNRYKSPLQIWLEKTGRAEAPDLSGNQAVEWGNRLEDVIAERFQDGHPDFIVRKKNAMLVSKRRPWAYANLDRTVRDGDREPCVLEVKTVGWRRASDWDDGVPLYYQTQVLHYLAVTGYARAYVAALIGGQDYREHVIEPDADDLAAVEQAVDTFWGEYVVPDIMPALIGNPDEGGALMGMYGEPDGDFANGGGELNALVEQLQDLKARQSETKAEIDRVTNTVKAAIGSHDGAVSDLYRVTWSRSSCTRFDSKRFRAEHPDMADEYTTTVLRDNGLKVKELM